MDGTPVYKRTSGTLKDFGLGDGRLYHGTDKKEAAVRLIKHGADQHHPGGTSRQLGNGIYVTNNPATADIHGKYRLTATVKTPEAETLRGHRFVHKTRPDWDTIGKIKPHDADAKADFRTAKYNKPHGQTADQVCFTRKAIEKKVVSFEVDSNMPESRKQSIKEAMGHESGVNSSRTSQYETTRSQTSHTPSSKSSEGAQTARSHTPSKSSEGAQTARSHTPSKSSEGAQTARSHTPSKSSEGAQTARSHTPSKSSEGAQTARSHTPSKSSEGARTSQSRTAQKPSGSGLKPTAAGLGIGAGGMVALHIADEEMEHHGVSPNTRRAVNIAGNVVTGIAAGSVAGPPGMVVGAVGSVVASVAGIIFGDIFEAYAYMAEIGKNKCPWGDHKAQMILAHRSFWSRNSYYCDYCKCPCMCTSGDDDVIIKDERVHAYKVKKQCIECNRHIYPILKERQTLSRNIYMCPYCKTEMMETWDGDEMEKPVTGFFNGIEGVNVHRSDSGDEYDEAMFSSMRFN